MSLGQTLKKKAFILNKNRKKDLQYLENKIKLFS